MANLGWDAQHHVVEQRAREILTEANVPPDTWQALTATRNKGSMAQILFTSEEALEIAAIRVNALRKSYPDVTHLTNNNVWLAVAKTREELRPNRLCHRAAQLITDLETVVQERKGAVTKDMRAKIVKVNDVPMGYSCSGRWVWTGPAKLRYTEDERRDVGEAVDATP